MTLWASVILGFIGFVVFGMLIVGCTALLVTFFPQPKGEGLFLGMLLAAVSIVATFIILANRWDAR